MMMTEMDIETSVYYVHLTRLIAREDYIKFTRRESTKTYIINPTIINVTLQAITVHQLLRNKNIFHVSHITYPLQKNIPNKLYFNTFHISVCGQEYIESFRIVVIVLFPPQNFKIMTVISG